MSGQGLGGAATHSADGLAITEGDLMLWPFRHRNGEALAAKHRKGFF